MPRALALFALSLFLSLTLTAVAHAHRPPGGALGPVRGGEPLAA